MCWHFSTLLNMAIDHKLSSIGARLSFPNIDYSVCPWPVGACQMIFLKPSKFVYSFLMSKPILMIIRSMYGNLYQWSSIMLQAGRITKWLQEIMILVWASISSVLPPSLALWILLKTIWSTNHPLPMAMDYIVWQKYHGMLEHVSLSLHYCQNVCPWQYMDFFLFPSI